MRIMRIFSGRVQLVRRILTSRWFRISQEFQYVSAGDWVMLARQLNITDDEIAKIQGEYTYVSEQALVMLHLWVQKNEGNATGTSKSWFFAEKTLVIV